MLRKQTMDSFYFINKQFTRSLFSTIPKNERYILIRYPRKKIELIEYQERIDRIKDISNKSFAKVPQETWDLLDKVGKFFEKLIIDESLKNKACSENCLKNK